MSDRISRAGTLLRSLQGFEYLSPESLAHLRRVNKAAQQLVDQYTGSVWKAAASALLDRSCLPSAEHAYAVQATLKEQGALLRSILSGKQLFSDRSIT